MEEKVKNENWWIGGILALALGLRLWGLGFGLPELYHADEPIVVHHALAYATGDFNPHFFKIPPLTSYLLFAVYGFYYLAGRAAGKFASPADFENLFYADPSSFYFLARLIFGALAGTLTVYFFYRMVRRHFNLRRRDHRDPASVPKSLDFGSGCALACAFLLSVCFLHVSDSHYVYADIPLLLVIVLALDAFWGLADKTSFHWKDHAAAGAWIGLAAAFKYNGVFLAVPYLTVLFSRGRRESFVPALAAAAAAGFLAFTLLNPFWLLDFSTFMQELRIQAQSNTGVGWLRHGTYSLPGALGWPVLAAAAAGMLSAGKDLKKRSLFFFSAGYYALLVAAGQPYPRYVLPLLPGLIFFAADFLEGRLRRYSRFFLVGGTLALGAFPLAKSLLWDRLMAAPDVRSLAKHWVETHLESGSKLALDWDFYMPRLSAARRQLLEKKAEASREAFKGAQERRLDFLIRNADETKSYELYFLVRDPLQARFLFARPALVYDLAVLERAGISHVLLLSGLPNPAGGNFYRDAAARGKVIAVFSPYKDKNRLQPLDATPMTGGPYTWPEIRSRERSGHAIEIVQLAGGQL